MERLSNEGEESEAEDAKTPELACELEDAACEVPVLPPSKGSDTSSTKSS